MNLNRKTHLKCEESFPLVDGIVEYFTVDEQFVILSIVSDTAMETNSQVKSSFRAAIKRLVEDQEILKKKKRMIEQEINERKNGKPPEVMNYTKSSRDRKEEDVIKQSTNYGGQSSNSIFDEDTLPQELNSLSKEIENIEKRNRILCKTQAILVEKVDHLGIEHNVPSKKLRSSEETESVRNEYDTILQHLATLIKGPENTENTDKENIINYLRNCNEEFEVVKNENKILKDQVKELENMANTVKMLNATVSHLMEDVKDLQERQDEQDAKYKNEINELNDMIKPLIEDRNRLVIGQVAYRFEEKIARIVLPDEDLGEVNVFKEMLKSLENNEKAQQRWVDLKEKLGWNERKHKKAISEIKKIRRTVAHPNIEEIDIEKVRQQMRDGKFIDERYQKDCEEIFDMMKFLTNNTEQS